MPSSASREISAFVSSVQLESEFRLGSKAIFLSAEGDVIVSDAKFEGAGFDDAAVGELKVVEFFGGFGEDVVRCLASNVEFDASHEQRPRIAVAVDDCAAKGVTARVSFNGVAERVAAKTVTRGVDEVFVGASIVRVGVGEAASSVGNFEMRAERGSSECAPCFDAELIKASAGEIGNKVESVIWRNAVFAYQHTV